MVFLELLTVRLVVPEHPVADRHLTSLDCAREGNGTW